MRNQEHQKMQDIARDGWQDGARQGKNIVYEEKPQKMPWKEINAKKISNRTYVCASSSSKLLYSSKKGGMIHPVYSSITTSILFQVNQNSTHAPTHKYIRSSSFNPSLRLDSVPLLDEIYICIF